jgi:signal transduction histidine kinase
MWGHFHGEEEYVKHLHDWTPQFRREIWQRALAEQGVEDKELAGRSADFFVRRRRELSEHLPGAEQVLRTLQRAGIRIGLLTNGAASLQREKIETSGLGLFFDAAVVSGEIGTGKPEPAIFNHLLDRVEQAFRMQRMFLSNVSHELRNPLTAMRMQIDVVLQRERPAAEYRAALESLLEDLRQISDVEEKLLLLAKMQNDPSAIPFAPTRIDELIWQTKEWVEKRHPHYKISLEYENMPESADNLLVQANEALLQTALMNLCENGCKYAPDHQALLRLVCDPAGRHVVEICDRGSGIPDSELPLIFEPFFRSPRHRNIRGAGIGLSLVQSILKIHHIQLEVEKNMPTGAVFRLLFAQESLKP